MYEVGRPTGYESRIFKSMMSVGYDDALIHLGDVCIGKDEEMHERYIEPLQCKKILVRGNHDKKSDSWYYDHGWDFVCDEFVLHKYGYKIVFSHIPLPLTNIDVGIVNVHGHLHNMEHRNAELTKFHRLISLEKHGYEVQSLQKVIQNT